MCSEAFWKNLTAFCLAFVFGISMSSFFGFHEKRSEISTVSKFYYQNTLFDPPTPLECKKQDLIADLEQERSEMIDWLKKNENAPHKERKAKLKEIEDLNLRIRVLENIKEFKKHLPEEKTTSDLLYRCR